MPPDDPWRELIESAGLDVPAIEREHQQAQFSQLCDALARQLAEEEYDQVRAQFPDDEIHLEDGRIPYVRTQQEEWELRFFPPAHVEIHHASAGFVRWFSMYNHAGVPMDALSAITMEDLRRFLAWQVKRIVVPCPGGRGPGWGEPEM